MYKIENGQKAESQRKARYIKEKCDTIQAHVQKGYAEKLAYIADTMNTSKAKALEKCIDTLYNDLWLNE